MAFPLVVGGVALTVAAGSAVVNKLLKGNDTAPNKNDASFGDNARKLFDYLNPNMAIAPQYVPEQAKYCHTPSHGHR